jgi:hypothetical protein
VSRPQFAAYPPANLRSVPLEPLGAEHVLNAMSVDPSALDYAAVGIPESVASQLRERSYPDSWGWFWRRYLALSYGLSRWRPCGH